MDDVVSKQEHSAIEGGRKITADASNKFPELPLGKRDA